MIPYDLDDKYCLKSDSRWRPDSLELLKENVDGA